MDRQHESQILHYLGYAVFEYDEQQRLKSLGPLPAWWPTLVPTESIQEGMFLQAETLPFLENFLVDARRFWDQPSAGCLDSGPWQPSGADAALLLEASAICTPTANVLAIRNLAELPTWAEFLQHSRGTQLSLLRDIARHRQLEIELTTAKETAEQLDRAKTDFVANISHEMRTPLANILASVEILEGVDADGSAEPIAAGHSLRDVRQSAEQLLKVVNDVLDVARMDRGSLELAKETIDLSKLMRELDADYRPAAEERGLTFQVSAADELPALRTDATRLRQALNNLIDNAIRFTTFGSVQVRIQAEDSDLHFAVNDTGVGIDPDDQDRVFRSFEQGDSSASREFGGMGLGLSLAQRLVTHLGGQLSMESRLGQGSRFWFRLPIESAAEKASPDRPDTARGPWRVLVAEDNPVNRSFMTHVLQKNGHEVVLAENGEEAVEAFATGSPVDLILMDCQMPVMSGFEAARAIREIESRTGGYMPIIAVTAHTAEVDRRRCEAAGMKWLVTKPFKTGDLLDKMRLAVLTYRQPSNPNQP